MTATVLVVGSGYLGRALAAALERDGARVVVSSRRPVPGVHWARVDVTDAASVQQAVDVHAPDAIVLAHGPSDITWCHENPAVAMRVHHGGALNVARAAPRTWKLLVSTDNVFDGVRPSYGESDAPSPANGYGDAKAAAERALLADGATFVLRVSLVYGWDDAAARSNFFALAARRLAAGERVAAPVDHWNTPVLVDDFASWGRALVHARPTGLVHLGGRDRVTRYEWARCIARTLGYDESLVVPAEKRSTPYACRPVNACLHSERAALVPGLAGLSPHGIADGAARLRDDARAPVRPA